MVKETPQALTVGIVCQTLVQQHHLRHIVHHYGYNTSSSFLIDQVIADLTLLEQNAKDVALWLVDVDMSSLEQTPGLAAFEAWLYNLREPVIFGEGTTYNATDSGFSSWSRQLHEKIFGLGGQIIHAKRKQNKVKALWVLAASIGGPEAVKQFLDNLPTGLGLGFLYAQHLEAKQHKALTDTLCRNSDYTATMAAHGDFVTVDQVTVVPASNEVTLMPSGMVMFREGSWRGAYRPSIDQVVANVADAYGSASGVIFFSGMGDDGVAGARLMARRGGKVWIQAPATCASDNMPNAINDTGCVTQIGTPKQLAELVTDIYRQTEESLP